MAIPKLITALVLVSMATQPSLSEHISYEAQDTILGLTTEKDLATTNFAKYGALPIYRNDLSSTYVAYYLIRTRKMYYLLSAGPKTGDSRVVESGEVNATAKQYCPTDVLIKQARVNGQYCAKFYRLCGSAGLYICDNRQGFPVAATYNWTANAPINTSDLKSLLSMVKESMPVFNKECRELSCEVKEEWKGFRYVQEVQKEEGCDEEALEAGSRHKISLGLHGYQSKLPPRIFFTGTGGKKSDLTNAEWQERLCKVLMNVCTGKDSTVVNSQLFRSGRNGINYFEISVHQDHLTLQKLLHNIDIGFRIQVPLWDGTVIEKCFGFDTSYSSRTKRWSSWAYWSIYSPDLFPNYNQHQCCGCYSGCGAVAWAQVFAYYDRLAHASSSYGYNQNIYQGSNGVSGSSAYQPPWYTPTQYVENIRAQIDTFCLFGGGATTHWDMADIKLLRWFRTRQCPLPGKLSSYTSWWSSLPGIYTNSIRNAAINDLKHKYPAIVGIWVGASQHYAVATRYRTRHKKWRICWWFFGWHCTQWFYIHQHEWYLHMGWGGSGNAWRKARAFSAFVAKKEW